MADENFPKVSSHSQKEEKDIATIERTEDDRSWMELSFVDNDGGSFADHSTTLNAPPQSVSLDALVIDDGLSISSDELNDNPKDEPSSSKPAEEDKPASRRRPKKTKIHRKTKSFDERILMDSEKTGKKKKKREKTSKKNKGDGSEEFSAKSKTKQKRKNASEKDPTSDGTGDALLGEDVSSDDHSLLSNQSSASKNSKRRGLKSLSPLRIRNPLRGGPGLVRQLSGTGGGLLGRAKGLKDQLALSEHAPRDKKGIIGTVLYASFDDDDDSDVEDDD